MTIAELKRLIAELPDDMTVEIFASQSGEDMVVAMVELHEKANSVLLMDRRNDDYSDVPDYNGKLIYDIRSRWEG